MNKISWLMPVRNGFQWLKESTSSVLLEMHRDDEFIIVDDGSNGTIERFLPLDDRIRLIKQPPLGIVAALNNGIAQSTGTYIARIDADDIVEKGRSEKQRAYLNKHPNCGVVGGNARLFSNSGFPGLGMQRYVEWVNNLTDFKKSMFIESPIFHPSVMIRKSTINDVGGYIDGPFPEDYELWLRIYSAGWSVHKLNDIVVSLRDHQSRLTRTDVRYSKKSFLSCKQMYFSRLILDRFDSFAVWGAGKGGKPWIRYLLQSGKQVSVIDNYRKGIRQGLAICEPTQLCELQPDAILVAVGARGARELIRNELKTLLPNFKEGEQWFAVI